MESILELSEDGKTIIGVKDSDVTHIDILNSITIMWHYFVVSLFICSFVLRNG